MLKLAVIGKDVSASLSPKIHPFILESMGEECVYDAVSIPPEAFSLQAESLFEQYDGFNVTIPYKGDIIPLLRELRGDSKTFGAVNTVKSRARAGYNTDGFGFLLMLENAGVEVKGKSVLVFGAGGAGRSCIKKLMEAGAKVFVFEANSARLKEVYREFGGFTPLERVPVRAFDIILNCTGVGMHNTVGQTPCVAYEDGSISPVGEELLSLCDTAVDLIYVPAQSQFLKIAADLGKKTVNGESMLFYQAYMADCIYLDRAPSSAEAGRLFKEYKEKNV